MVTKQRTISRADIPRESSVSRYSKRLTSLDSNQVLAVGVSTVIDVAAGRPAAVAHEKAFSVWKPRVHVVAATEPSYLPNARPVSVHHEDLVRLRRVAREGDSASVGSPNGLPGESPLFVGRQAAKFAPVSSSQVYGFGGIYFAASPSYRESDLIYRCALLDRSVNDPNRHDRGDDEGADGDENRSESPHERIFSKEEAGARRARCVRLRQPRTPRTRSRPQPRQRAASRSGRACRRDRRVGARCP